MVFNFLSFFVHPLFPFRRGVSERAHHGEHGSPVSPALGPPFASVVAPDSRVSAGRYGRCNGSLSALCYLLSWSPCGGRGLDWPRATVLKTVLRPSPRPGRCMSFCGAVQDLTGKGFFLQRLHCPPFRSAEKLLQQAETWAHLQLRSKDEAMYARCETDPAEEGKGRRSEWLTSSGSVCRRTERQNGKLAKKDERKKETCTMTEDDDKKRSTAALSTLYSHNTTLCLRSEGDKETAGLGGIYASLQGRKERELPASTTLAGDKKLPFCPRG